MFSFKSFTVSGLPFRPLIHFESIFVYGVRECSNFILLYVAIQFSQPHLLKRLSFSSLCILASFVIDQLTIVEWVYFWAFYPVPLIYISVWGPIPNTNILMIVALQYSLKPGNLILLALFPHLRIALAIQGLLCFNTNNFFFQFFEKCHWLFDKDCIESVDSLRQYRHFHNIILATPQNNIFFHLCVSSSISFTSVLQFSE